MTTVYTKTGKQICKHFSKLPGGSKETRTGKVLVKSYIKYI